MVKKIYPEEMMHIMHIIQTDEDDNHKVSNFYKIKLLYFLLYWSKNLNFIDYNISQT